MENELTKDMIIKLHLPDSTLNRLLEVSKAASLDLPTLFAWFIEDLTDDTSPGSVTVEEWLYERSGKLEHEEREDPFADVKFNDNQMEMMHLLDLIMDE